MYLGTKSMVYSMFLEIGLVVILLPTILLVQQGDNSLLNKYHVLNIK